MFKFHFNELLDGGFSGHTADLRREPQQLDGPMGHEDPIKVERRIIYSEKGRIQKEDKPKEEEYMCSTCIWAHVILSYVWET